MQVDVRLNHKTSRFRVIVDGVTAARADEVEWVSSAQGPILACYDHSLDEPGQRQLQFEVQL